MENNKLLKKILIFLIMFLIIMFSNNIKSFAFATNYKDEIIADEVSETVKIASSDFVDPAEDPDWWEPGKSNEKELAEKAGTLLGVINVVGVVSAIIALTLLGMKYFLGSVQEKVEFKNSIGIYILGIILLVACTTLPNIIFNFSQEIFK